VNLKLQHTFARVAVRSGKENREAFVERLTGLVKNRCAMRDARPQRGAGAYDAFGEPRYLRPADAYDRDRAFSRRSRDRRNGVGQRGWITTRRSGSSPSDSVRTRSDVANAR
jgi:hypothetical protein